MAQNLAMFDGYIAVDWSASVSRRHGKNSIWIAVLHPGEEVQFRNPGTRIEAIKCIAAMLNDATAGGRRLLCGFDFPFGYPRGTAQSLTGHNNWDAVWRLIANVIEDGPDNQNKRFQAAAGLNEHFDGEGPFWGRPANPIIPGLGTNRPLNGWGQNLPPRRRHIEEEVPRAQEVWKLYYPGNVGSQALTGIAALERRLRHRNDVEIWPFETLGEGRCHVLAEIYPSLIEPWPGNGVLDQRQVHAVAVRLQELDEAGLLVGRLQAPGNMPAVVQNEEGLFLDIT